MNRQEREPLRILYVEDDASDFELVQRALARHAPEYTLEHAPAVRVAMARLEGGAHYDALLTDLRLPDGSGLEILANVRRLGLPLATVVLTGSGDQESAVAALRAGADDYLAKREGYLEKLAGTIDTAVRHFRSDSIYRTRPMRVLYAEHDDDDADLTMRSLGERAPHIQLDRVRSGEELLQRIENNDPENWDVILVDYRMPRLDGLQVTRILKQEKDISLPVVIITGSGSEEVAAEALRLGVADYLVKHEGHNWELPAALEKVHREAELMRERSELRNAYAQLTRMLEASPAVTYTLAVEGDGLACTWISPNITRMLGYTVEEAMTPGWWPSQVHAEDRDRELAGIRVLMRRGYFMHEYRFHHKDGTVRWIRDEQRLVYGPHGNPVQVAGTWSDVTDSRRAEEELRLNAAVIESTDEGVVVTDLRPSVRFVNRAFTDLTGYTISDVLDRNPNVLKSGRHDAAFFETMWKRLQECGTWQGEIWNRRKNGEVYPAWMTISVVRNERGEATHYVGVFTDISRLKRTEERLDRLAHYDPLTNLPNRLLLLSRAEHAIDRARRHGYRVAVLFIDLDDFKTINDSLGHPVGDEVLAAVADRLQARLRSEDTLGRLGGDEFLLLLEQIDEPQDAVVVARDVLGCLEAPFRLPSGREVYIHASLGISLYPDNGQGAAELVRNADAAMYRAKAQGRNSYGFYTEDLTHAARQRLDLETRLRRALENEEFLVYFQPQRSIALDRTVGFEALVRWQPPHGEMIPPDTFISVAEESGLIVPLGEWVLRAACLQAEAWRKAGRPVETLAVNLSAKELRRRDILERIREILEETRLPPGCLEIELTESGLMESGLMERGREAGSTLHALKEMGVRIAIDDFGTGYSSLAYLRRFPIDRLKIDRSFLQGVPGDANSTAITATIIAMAHNLKLEAVAEGVEMDTQLQFLREHGCDLWQGFLCSRPLPAAEFEARFLKTS